jgi:hypothetical protein
MASCAEIDMTQTPTEQRVERLHRQLGVLRSRIAILPQPAQAEFAPLVDDLEAHLGRVGRQREGIRGVIEEIRAIDKCLRFELAVSQPDTSAGDSAACCRSLSRRRRSPSAATPT